MGKCFKYRSLENLEHFLQIIVGSELYASEIEELNDPMEGRARFYNISDIDKKTFKDEIVSKTFVCSLTEKKEDDEKPNGHMFALYANGHKGCCFDLNVTARTTDDSKPTDWKKIKVNYSEVIPKITSITDSTVVDILSTKRQQWEEENEVRFIKTAKKKMRLKIKIDKV